MQQLDYGRVFCLTRSAEMLEMASEARTETLHETYIRLATDWLRRAAQDQRADLVEEK